MRSHPTATAVVLSAGALVLAACGGGQADSGSSARTNSATPDPSVAVSTTSTTAAPTNSPPETADGTDYQACTDGNCEVKVPIGTRISLPSGNFVLVRITRDGLAQYDLRLPDGERQVNTIGPDGYYINHLPDGGLEAAHDPSEEAATPPVGVLVVQLLKVNRKTGVFRFVYGR